MMKRLFLCLLAVLVGTAPCATAESSAEISADDLHLDCMTIIVGKDASATGRVLIAHNEDDTGRCVVHHGYVPAADWPEGTVLPAEEGRAAIPQAAHTLGYYWSQVRAGSRGLSGADIFLNEAGVCIVSNNNAESNEKNMEDLKDGGIEYNLRRIVAERATSAREALDIIIALVEEWGYASSGRAYTVADSEEAYMIQLVRGRRYIAARIPDDSVVVMPNHYTFHGLDDVPEMYYSEDLVDHAIEMGWYTPAVEGDFSDFDFSAAYQEPSSYRLDYNVLRQKYAMEILLDRAWNVDEEGLPFAIQPETPVTLETLAEVLSCHYEGTEHDERFGPGASPHDTAVRHICTGSTLEATIFDLGETPLCTTAWTAFGRPCQLPLLPLHPLAGTVDEVDRMEDPALEMAEHLRYRDQATVYADSGWQAFRDFENLHEMVYSDEIEALTALKNELYQAHAAQNAQLMDTVDGLLAQGQTGEAVAKLREFDRTVTLDALERLEDHAETHFNEVQIEEHTPFSLSMPDMPYVVTFSCDEKPVESELLFGMGFTSLRMKYAPALEGTLTDLGDGRYSAAFDPFILMDSAVCAGEYEFFLGGKTEDGKAFGGMTVLTFEE